MASVLHHTHHNEGYFVFHQSQISYELSRKCVLHTEDFCDYLLALVTDVIVVQDRAVVNGSKLQFEYISWSSEMIFLLDIHPRSQFVL